MPTLVIDANVMLSAVLGRSLARIIELVKQDIGLVAPMQQIAEVRTVLARRDRLEDAGVLARLDALVEAVEPLSIELFAANETRARRRLQPRGQSDWPVLAAALTIEASIWSLDRDFFGVGVPVWSTGNLDIAVAEGTLV